MLDRYMMEEKEQWREWADKIPYIKWPTDWLVKAVPPFAGAVIRYYITLPNKKGRVSVYLDCYNALGYYDMNQAPYWEVYPINNDTHRCAMDDTKSLLKSIKKGLKQLEENN